MMCNSLLDGKYKILKVLGQGGMGTVYLAENIRLGTLWAVKEIQKRRDLKFDLLAEPNMLKKLEHPALPRVFDIFEDEESIYIVVDYIEGVSLDKELKAAGKLPEHLVIDYAVQICRVLDYLHSQQPNPIIYRDMKPSNIIVTKGGSVKLIDFGIAREYKAQSDNDTVYIGTRGYAAPEQYGSGQTGVAADIYSLGITLHHLLTGKNPNEPPYEIRPVSNYDESLSSGIAYIIERCTRSKPLERYQSAVELMQDIEKLCKPRTNVSCGEKREEYAPPTGGKVAYSFRRLLLGVWGNSEFACELAYMASKLTGYKILLADLDFMESRVDICLGIRGQVEEKSIENGQNWGLGAIIRDLDKKCLDFKAISDRCFRIGDIKNLYILTQPFNIENLEFCGKIDISELLECFYRNFDITIVSVNKSISNPITKAALAQTDYNMISIPASSDAIREFEGCAVYAHERLGIPVDKLRLAAYEYKDGINLPENVLGGFFTKGSYIGNISYRTGRERCRSIGVSFVVGAVSQLKEEYGEILERLGILPVKSRIDRIWGWLGGKVKRGI